MQHSCALQGVVQSSYQPWTTLQPVACLTAPCNFRHPVRTCPCLVSNPSSASIGTIPALQWL